MATDIYSIKFTAHARKDLDRIFSYIASELYAPQAATRIMKMIDQSISNLSTQPFIAPLINDEFLSKKGLRKFIVDCSFVISLAFYLCLKIRSLQVRQQISSAFLNQRGNMCSALLVC